MNSAARQPWPRSLTNSGPPLNRCSKRVRRQPHTEPTPSIAPCDDEDGTRLADTLGAPEPGYLQAELSATLEAMMSVLSDREREILRLRFAEDLTQSEIGQRVGVSQMHISRLLREAVTRLRETAQTSENPAATRSTSPSRAQRRS